MKVDGRVLVYSENLEYLKIEDFLKCLFEELMQKYFVDNSVSCGFSFGTHWQIRNPVVLQCLVCENNMI